MHKLNPMQYQSAEAYVEATKLHQLEVIEGVRTRFEKHSFDNAADFKILRNIVGMATDEEVPNTVRTQAAMLCEAALLSAIKNLPFRDACIQVIADDTTRKPEDMTALREIFAMMKELDLIVAEDEAAASVKN